MLTAVYGAIIFVATLLGAFVGLGGGVIIKPLLDLIGRDSVDAVNFISCCAVFSMSISSIVRHIRAKTEIEYGFVIRISIGAVAGGVCGGRLFDYMLSIVDASLLRSLQGAMLGVLLIAAVLYVNLAGNRSLEISKGAAAVPVGLLMGFVAAFLGIGGGPINVAVLMLFFGIDIRQSAVYSVCTIFFSQLSRLIAAAVAGSIPSVSPYTIAVAVFCAVLGGVLGATANRRGNERAIRIIFSITVASVAAVSLYNVIN